MAFYDEVEKQPEAEPVVWRVKPVWVVLSVAGILCVLVLLVWGIVRQTNKVGELGEQVKTLQTKNRDLAKQLEDRSVERAAQRAVAEKQVRASAAKKKSSARSKQTTRRGAKNRAAKKAVRRR